MSYSFPARANETEKYRAEYTNKLIHMDLREAVTEFLSYLDYIEESDNGIEFHPIMLSSCRVLMTEPLHMVIERIRWLI